MSKVLDEMAKVATDFNLYGTSEIYKHAGFGYLKTPFNPRPGSVSLADRRKCMVNDGWQGAPAFVWNHPNGFMAVEEPLDGALTVMRGRYTSPIQP